MHVVRMEEVRKTFKIFTGKRSRGRPGCIWDDNIRMDLKEIAVNTKNWVD